MKLDNFLNPKQKEAVLATKGPVLVLAGAGSGKTRTLTYRTAYLLDQGVKPENILTLTFTNKASEDMKKKIEELIGNKAKNLNTGTFHSICLKILMDNLHKVNRTYGVTIYDTDDSKEIIKDLVLQHNLDSKRYDKNALYNIISKAKMKLVEPKDLAKEFAKQNDEGSKLYHENVADIYKGYEKVLANNNCFDFNDLIKKTIELFEEYPAVLRNYQQQYKYIQIDEYQDANLSQYKIASMLAKPQNNIFAVGDDAQSIYRFRGADISNILEFEKDFQDAKIIKLERNYRSKSNILEVSNAVIKNNTQNKEKEVWSDKDQGEEIKIYENSNEYQEAEEIAQKIKGLVNVEDYQYQDIAILFRSNFQSRVLEEEFIKERIPHHIVSGVGFFDRKEIQYLLDYMRLVVNPKDHLMINKIADREADNIGTVTMSRIRDYAIQHDKSMFEVMNNPEKVKGIGKVKGESIRDFKNNIIDKVRNLYQDRENLWKATKEIIEELNIKDKIARMENYEDRLENLNELVNMVKQFENKSPNSSLEDFLLDIKLTQDQDKVNEDDNEVNLMTVHSAKGLEFPVIFVVGLEEEVFPHFYSIKDKQSGKDRYAIEEERRLFYVALTRAEEKLYLSYNNARYKYGSLNMQSPSRFIEELPEEKIIEIVNY